MQCAKRLTLCLVMLTLSFVITMAQDTLRLVRANEAQAFPAVIPAGNYSGICRIADNLYALADDKSATDGFHLVEIQIDSVQGNILSVAYRGFISTELPNRDAEGIAYNDSLQSLFVVGESDNSIAEYSLTGNLLRKSDDLCHILQFSENNLHNSGFESLTYNAVSRQFFTCTEAPLPSDTTIRIAALSPDFAPLSLWRYALDVSSANQPMKIQAHGVSELCSLRDGSLLVLERDACVPEEIFGAFVDAKIYQVFPNHSAPNSLLSKSLLWQTRTDISLFHQDFANYEGLCVGPTLIDGSQVLILVADSQNRYGSVLQDWFLTLVVR